MLDIDGIERVEVKPSVLDTGGLEPATKGTVSLVPAVTGGEVLVTGTDKLTPSLDAIPVIATAGFSSSSLGSSTSSKGVVNSSPPEDSSCLDPASETSTGGSEVALVLFLFLLVLVLITIVLIVIREQQGIISTSYICWFGLIAAIELFLIAILVLFLNSVAGCAKFAFC